MMIDKTIVNHEVFMRRCFDLARLGAGNVSPNPMVGAVLVHDNRIIGEGWHKGYGQAHAEVNAVADVSEEESTLIKEATLYVSLEPCCIFGKTPPCTDLILKNGIKKVVVSCIDQTAEVKGKGLMMLKEKGVTVIEGVLKEEGEKISAIRNTFTQKTRPYIQLKYAKTRNGYMGKKGEQIWISNLLSKRLAHKMRAEFDAILVGTNTALTDSPQLTNRLWFGRSPLRVLIDRNLKVPMNNGVFSPGANTIVFTENNPPASSDSVHFVQMPFDDNLVENMLAELTARKVTSLIVEGGANTLNRFVAKGLWDECWAFTGKRLIEGGILAPIIEGEIVGEWPMGDDLLTIYRNSQQ